MTAKNLLLASGATTPLLRILPDVPLHCASNGGAWRFARFSSPHTLCAHRSFSWVAHPTRPPGLRRPLPFPASPSTLPCTPPSPCLRTHPLCSGALPAHDVAFMAFTPGRVSRSSTGDGAGRRVRRGVATAVVTASVVAAVGTLWWVASETLTRSADGFLPVGRGASRSISAVGHAVAASVVGTAGSALSSRPPRLVFIDAGGNTGQTVEWFRNGTALAGDIFKSTYHTTSADPAAYEVVVFEPNPVFAPNYVALRNEKGLDFTLIPAAISDADGWVDFSGAGQGGLVSAGGVRISGGPTIDDNGSVVARASTDARPGEVPAIDFSAWLSRTFSPDDYLLCKLDIEGSESPVLRKMLIDGTICACNRLSVEWHMWLGAPEDPHAIGMNVPAALANDSAGGRMVGADGKGVSYSCSIPHARRQLPYSECVLPKMVEWVRRACPRSSPLEKWF